MSSAVDRMADGYQPDFDIDSEVGRQGELFVARIVDSIKDESAEVKTDEKALRTGNVFLEYECQYRGEWRGTGIASPEHGGTKATFWCHVVGEVLIAAPTARVREVARYLWRFKSQRKEMNRGSHPTRGILVPIEAFVRYLVFGVPEVSQESIDGDAEGMP